MKDKILCEYKKEWRRLVMRGPILVKMSAGSDCVDNHNYLCYIFTHFLFQWLATNTGWLFLFSSNVRVCVCGGGAAAHVWIHYAQEMKWWFHVECTFNSPSILFSQFRTIPINISKWLMQATTGATMIFFFFICLIHTPYNPDTGQNLRI
jgi:hypothetical protein